METSGLTGLLDVAAAAGVLGSTALAVKRLIARNRLRAVRLGAGKVWRIDADEIRRYVAAGAPDFDPPPRGNDEPWFQNIRSAAHFPQAVINAAADQAPEIMPANVPEGGAVQLRITPAIAAAIKGRPAIFVGDTLTVPADADAVFPDWRTAYLVERVHRFALEVLGTGDGSPPLARFYESPRTYLHIVDAAIRQTLAGAISFGKVYAWMDRGLPVQRQISFELPHAVLAPPTTMATVLSLAF
jgi:excisionase family DNA binding protein